MYKTSIFIICILLISSNLRSQDDFKFPSSSDIGLNITTVLTSFIGNSNNEASIESYPFVAKVNRKKSAIRFGMGVDLGNSNETLADVEQFIFNNYQVNGRVGYERKKYLGHRFGFFYGVDLVSSIKNEEFTVSNNIDVTSILENTFSIGSGPVYGFEYYLNKFMYLGTEGSFYGIYSFSNRKESFRFNPEINSERNTRNFSARMTTPTRLYIMVRF